MTERAGVVRTIHGIGVKIGPPTESTCEVCGHVWGDHLLHPLTENALDGGTWSCPAPNCTCFGTWDVPMPSALRAAYDEKVARRVQDL